MAYIGLARPIIARLDESSGTPKYTDGCTCGKAIGVDIEPQFAEGSLSADNGEAEYDKEFQYANITLNTSTLPLEAHETMFGHQVTKDGEKSIIDSNKDEANYVGMGVYASEKVSGVKSYVAIWIFKAKFSEGTENYKTKGSSIEYQTPSISGRAVNLEDGKWRERKIFATEAEAVKWLEEQAGIQVTEGP